MEPAGSACLLIPRLHGLGAQAFHQCQGVEGGRAQRIDNEIELRLLDRLRDPGDAVAGRTLANPRGEREVAEARLEQRRLVAPAAGTGADVRVREGQRVEPGDAVLSRSVDREETTLVWTASCPGGTSTC